MPNTSKKGKFLLSRKKATKHKKEVYAYGRLIHFKSQLEFRYKGKSGSRFQQRKKAIGGY